MRDKLGTPALISQIFFDELMNLQGDAGARKLIEKNKNLDIPQFHFPKELLILTHRKITMPYYKTQKN